MKWWVRAPLVWGALGTMTAAAAEAPPQAQAQTPLSVQQRTRVAAFARLYGVVRYFYPGDGAQQVDWNRLAVLGAGEAARARDAHALQGTLQALFAPLGPGIDVAASGTPLPPWHGGETPPLVAWHYLGFPSPRSVYRGERTHRAGVQAFSGLTTQQSATPLRGHAVRLRGELRALDREAAHQHAGLWLRADRANHSVTFFRNTAKEQVPDQAWHPYTIQTTLAQDVETLNLGVTLTASDDGATSAVAVRHLELAVDDGHGGWKALPLPALAAAATPGHGWIPVGAIDGKTSPAQWHDDQGGYLQLAEAGGPDALFSAPPRPGRVATFPLGDGLTARVALTLGDGEAKVTPARAEALTALKARLTSLPDPHQSIDSTAVRQGDAVAAWSALRHFYPYEEVLTQPWDAVLDTALADTAHASSRETQMQALQRLLAPLQDAHGTVMDSAAHKRLSLPVQLAPVAGQWVVVATTEPQQARVGDVVTALDGVPMPQAADAVQARMSGRPGVRPWKALQTLAWGPSGQTHAFSLRHADGTTSAVSLAYSEARTPQPPRPAAVAELAPGVWYVDLARARLEDVAPRYAQLAAARAVIYDDRGYPKDFRLTQGLLEHLLTHPEHARWMHIPRYVGPFGERAGYDDLGWDLQPATPHLGSRALFLIAGSTISQAEAFAGYVQDERLGTLIGGTTAGVDGNLATMMLPSGMGIIFTGMKVTHHDGTGRYQALGTTPDVPVEPTVAGVRAGKDEVLEAALRMATAAK